MYKFKYLGDNADIGNEVVRPENFRERNYEIQIMKFKIR